MNNNSISCNEMSLKVMALLDGELDSTEIDFVQNHLKTCDDCRQKFETLNKVKEITGDMKFKKLPEMYWDDYWKNIYNRIERGFSWILISIGIIVVLSFFTWNFIDEILSIPDMNPVLKGGILILILGFIILLVSVLREKMMVRKIDKYRKVVR